MLLIRIAAFIALLAAGFALPAGPLAAQGKDLAPAVVAVLDFQAVIRDAQAARDIRRQVDAYSESYKAQVAGEEDRIRQDEVELRRQQSILAPDAFDKKRQAFERRVIDLQRRVQDGKRRLDRTYDKAMTQVRNAIVTIVEEMTRTDGFNVVVDRSQILFASRSLDITDRVLKALDQRLPAVKVDPPR